MPMVRRSTPAASTRNLSQREFAASYGNRLDAQGRAIKDLSRRQLPRPEIDQELEALRSENAQMRSDGQCGDRRDLGRECRSAITARAKLRRRHRRAATAAATGLWTRRSAPAGLSSHRKERRKRKA